MQVGVEAIGGSLLILGQGGSFPQLLYQQSGQGSPSEGPAGWGWPPEDTGTNVPNVTLAPSLHSPSSQALFC